MTTAYLALVSGASCVVGAMAAWRFTSDHYRSRLSEASLSLANYKAWWERDNGKMLIAQAELDLIAEQRRSAGRQSHKAERELFRETADRLSTLPPQPLRSRAEIEAEVAELRAARKAQLNLPDAANPAPGNPAGVQRPGKRAERAGVRSRRQDAGLAPWPTLLAKGDSIDPECRLAKPRGDSNPADFTMKKGTI